MVPLTQYRFEMSELISPPTHPQQNRQLYRHKLACLCVLPMVVVAAGATLVGSGMGLWSTRAMAKNILVLIGMAVYMVGFFYYIVVNLAYRSCLPEEESVYDRAQADISTSEITTVVMDHEGFTGAKEEAETII